ncbi:hypothetical protein R1flu_017335 [Riccia fluitans]|uniref:Uncharacterized protein n=1 Tax=Riccia fluitans TaxID=41844 RepID=A0ABD1ZDQ4_9MARC
MDARQIGVRVEMLFSTANSLNSFSSHLHSPMVVPEITAIGQQALEMAIGITKLHVGQVRNEFETRSRAPDRRIEEVFQELRQELRDGLHTLGGRMNTSYGRMGIWSVEWS